MRKPIPYSCPVCGNRLPRAASRCFFCEYPLPMNKGEATQSAWSSSAPHSPRGAKEAPTAKSAYRRAGLRPARKSRAYCRRR